MVSLLGLESGEKLADLDIIHNKYAAQRVFTKTNLEAPLFERGGKVQSAGGRPRL